jgi:hypothetical protein
MIVGCGPVMSADSPPKVPNEFPVEEGRFEYTKLDDNAASIPYLITDKKTGCQYMTRSRGGYISLGCFPEYISPKFKK